MPLTDHLISTFAVCLSHPEPNLLLSRRLLIHTLNLCGLTQQDIAPILSN
jgi:hypothetical protein